MRIALVSGSRSDRNALEMVHRVLAADHDVRWIKTVYQTQPHVYYPPQSSFDAVNLTKDSIELVKGHLISTDKTPCPDMVFLHGDRYEILGAAMAANVMGVPIAHIGGGDITEGSQDDCFRHAITKLSHLHFASNQDSADRIIQMGEQSDRVHVTGCPGIDMVMVTPTLGRDETFAAVGLATPHRSLLVLFHPDTLGDTAAELEALSVALARRTEALVLIGPNADAGSDLIRREWQRLAQNRPDTVYYDNVEPQVFYSLLKWCDVLVGNSSAGFYEAPQFGIPTVNIGDRQKGRGRPYNVVQCDDFADINKLIANSLMLGYAYHSAGPRTRHGATTLYGDGHAAERIAKVIGGIKDPKALLRKKFHHKSDIAEIAAERCW